MLDGEDVVSPGDLLGAFINDDLRGLAMPLGPIPFGPNEGTYAFASLIYSNEIFEENITFKFYDHETNDQLAQMFKDAEKGNKEINIERTEDIKETNSEIVATGCPFCNTMLTDGAKTIEEERKISVMDISELIAKAQDL